MKWYTPLGAVTVWEHSPSGEVLIADCRNPNLPLASQRVNARLAAAAPDLLEALRDARWGVIAIVPRNRDEVEGRAALLARIDAALARAS